MKIIEPKVTCLLMSHMKPTLMDAINSLDKQDLLHNVEVVIMDSGFWQYHNDFTSERMREIYELVKIKTPFEWYMTGEPVNARELYCPVSHWTNKAFELGLIRGKYFCTFYDDDIYYANFMSTMSKYLDDNPSVNWVRCTENRVQIKKDGTRNATPPLTANCILDGLVFDCSVDGMQVMYRTEVFNNVPRPIMEESADWSSCSHSDGLMLNRLSQYFGPMHFIEEPLCEHHNTEYSTFTPTT